MLVTRKEPSSLSRLNKGRLFRPGAAFPCRINPMIACPLKAATRVNCLVILTEPDISSREPCDDFYDCKRRRPRVGRNGTALPLLGYVATRYQYGHDHRHIPDGLLDSELSRIETALRSRSSSTNSFASARRETRSSVSNISVTTNSMKSVQNAKRRAEAEKVGEAFVEANWKEGASSGRPCSWLVTYGDQTRGMRKVKRVSSGDDATVNVPSWACAISQAMYSPSPSPCWPSRTSPRKNG